MSAVYMMSSGFYFDLAKPIYSTYTILKTKFDGWWPGYWLPCPLKTRGLLIDLPGSIYIVFVSLTYFTDCPSALRICFL